MLPSYRNQSVGLLCGSTDWFLYDGKIGRERINYNVNIYLGKIRKKFQIHLHPSIPTDVFKQNRFAPLKNNIRSNWYEGLDTAAIEEIGKWLHFLGAAALRRRGI